MGKVSDINSSDKKPSNFVFWHKTRIFILLLSLTCLTLTQINSQIFTFTVICMNDLVEDHRLANYTEPHWIEGNAEKSVLFAAGAIGAVLGLIPSVPLIHSLGVRLTLSLCGFCSTIGTFFLPFAVPINFHLVLLCRVLQGIGVSALLTVLGLIPTSWSPRSESSTYLAILSCAWQLSNIIFMPVSGILCDSSLGWRSIYYLFGIITGFFFLVFYFFYTDSPDFHKNVSEKELSNITQGKPAPKPREPVPYLLICTDKCVIAAWISFLGVNLGFIILLFYGPTYLSEVLHFNVRETGFINAFPYFISVIYKFSVGKLSDKISFATDKTIYIFWMFSSIGGLAIGYIIMAITTDRLIAFGAFTFAIVTAGCFVMGTVKCLQMRCQQHVHFAVSAVSFLTYCVQFISPLGVGLLCPDGTPQQWSRLFLIIPVIMFISNAPFYWLSTTEPADYTRKKDQVEKC